MNEMTQIYDAVLKFLVIVYVLGLYSYGGRARTSKNWRRLGAPIPLIFYCSTMFSWLCLLAYPLFYGSFTVGYGKTSKLKKWIKSELWVRVITGLLYATASIPIAFLTGNWVVFGVQVAISVILVSLFGTQKIKLPAPYEEAVIAFFATGLVPWYKVG